MNLNTLQYFCAQAHKRTSAQAHKRTIIAIMVLLLSISSIGTAVSQVCSIDLVANCRQNPTANWRLISSNSTFSQLISQGILLPSSVSSSVPQFLVVCGTITQDMTGMYQFAVGSEIIMDR